MRFNAVGAKNRRMILRFLSENPSVRFTASEVARNVKFSIHGTRNQLHNLVQDKNNNVVFDGSRKSKHYFYYQKVGGLTYSPT